MCHKSHVTSTKLSHDHQQLSIHVLSKMSAEEDSILISDEGLAVKDIDEYVLCVV